MPLPRTPPKIQNRQFSAYGPDTVVDYAAIPLVKGGFTRSSNRLQSIEFMFNPTTVRLSHGWNWGRIAVPLRSHPWVSGGSGASEVFSFELYLDGDRGRMQHRSSFTNPRSLTREEYELANPDVTNSVNELRSLVLSAGDPNDDYSYNTPGGLSISLSFLSGECKISNVDVLAEAFLPDLGVLRSRVSITGEFTSPYNVTDWNFLRQTSGSSYQDSQQDPSLGVDPSSDYHESLGL